MFKRLKANGRLDRPEEAIDVALGLLVAFACAVGRSEKLLQSFKGFKPFKGFKGLRTGLGRP